MVLNIRIKNDLYTKICVRKRNEFFFSHLKFSVHYNMVLILVRYYRLNEKEKCEFHFNFKRSMKRFIETRAFKVCFLITQYLWMCFIWVWCKWNFHSSENSIVWCDCAWKGFWMWRSQMQCSAMKMYTFCTIRYNDLFTIFRLRSKLWSKKKYFFFALVGIN